VSTHDSQWYAEQQARHETRAVLWERVNEQTWKPLTQADIEQRIADERAAIEARRERERKRDAEIREQEDAYHRWLGGRSEAEAREDAWEDEEFYRIHR
jgi:hypothetical protein